MSVVGGRKKAEDFRKRRDCINKLKNKIMMKKEKKEVAPKATSANIEDTLQAIKTKFGDDAIMKLGEKPKVNVNAISTGSIGLDAALGIGGSPKRRIT